MAEWDPSAFGLTPVAAAQPVPAATTAPTAWDPSQFGLTPAVPQPVTATTPPVVPPADVGLRGPAAMRNHLLVPAEVTALVAGKDRALNDLTDRPAAWLAGLAGQGVQVMAQNQADRQAYDAQYGQDGAAQLGRVGGQAALTLPIMGAAGQVAGAGADAMAAGAGQVAPLAGSASQGAADFLAGTMPGSGGVVSRGIQGASVLANQGLQGAAAAGLTAGQSDAPTSEQMLGGAITGAAVGGGLRAATAGGSALVGTVSGGQVAPALADMARTARDKYGIMLTGDMLTDSPFLKTIGSQASQVPLSGMADAKGALQSQFTKAVAKTIGEDADQITPAVMQQAKTRIGGVMNDVAQRTGVAADPQFADDLQGIMNDSLGSMPASERPMLHKQVSDIVDMAANNAGTIPGDGYQTLTGYRSNIGTTLRAGSPIMKEFSGRLKDALDDAMERTAISGGNQDAIGALQNAKSQYKALKTIEPLVTKGEPGEITPRLLRGVVDKSYKGRALRADQPDLGELADIGQRFNLVPDSGTAGRAAGYAAMGTLGGAATQLFSGNVGNALMTASALPAVMLGARGATSYLTNPNVINRMLTASPVGAGGALSNSLTQYAAPTAEIARRNTLAQ